MQHVLKEMLSMKTTDSPEQAAAAKHVLAYMILHCSAFWMLRKASGASVPLCSNHRQAV